MGLLNGPSLVHHIHSGTRGVCFLPSTLPRDGDRTRVPRWISAQLLGADARRALAASETRVHPTAPRPPPHIPLLHPQPVLGSPSRPPANTPASPVTRRAPPPSATPSLLPPSPALLPAEPRSLTHPQVLASHPQPHVVVLGFALSLYVRDAPAAACMCPGRGSHLLRLHLGFPSALGCQGCSP